MNTLILTGVLLNLAVISFARYPVNRQERERLRNNRLNLHQQFSNTGSGIHGGFDPHLQQINRQNRFRDNRFDDGFDPHRQQINRQNRFRDNRFDPHFQPIVNDRFVPRADPHVVDPVVHDTVDISQVRQVGSNRRHPVSTRPRGNNVDRNVQKFGWSSLDSILPPSLINQFRNPVVQNPKPTTVVKGSGPLHKPKDNKPIVDKNTNDWQPPLVPGGLDLNGPLGPLDGPLNQGPSDGHIVPIGNTKPTDTFKTGPVDAGWNPNDSLPPLLDGVTLGPLGLDVDNQVKKGPTPPVIPVKPINTPNKGKAVAPDILWKAGGLDGVPPELLPSGLSGVSDPLLPKKLPKDNLPLPGGLNQNNILPKQPTDLPPTDFDHLFGLPPLPNTPGSPSTSVSDAGAKAGSNSNLLPPLDNLPTDKGHGPNTDLIPPLDQGTGIGAGTGGPTDSLDAFLADFEAGLFNLPPNTENAGSANPNDPLLPPISNSQHGIGGAGGNNKQLDLGDIAGLFDAHPEADPGPQAVSNAAKTVSEAQPNNQGLIKKNPPSGQNKQKSVPSGPAQSNSAAAARTEAGKISEGLTGEALLKSLQGLAARLAPSTTTTEAPTTKMDKRALLRSFGRRRKFNG